MKANEAPEKIYIFENPITETPDDRWLSKRSDKKDIEYTRTDYAEKVFLSKVNAWLAVIHRVCDITDENGYRIELEKLQANFKKYMED